jgi:hypothetical protein
MRSEMRRHVNNLKMISLRSGGMWSGQTNTWFGMHKLLDLLHEICVSWMIIVL